MAKYQEILDAINELKEGFGRVDERTSNIWTLTERQEKHLVKLNDSITRHAVQLSSNKTSIGRLWWLIGIAIVGGGGTGITKLIGLW